MKDKKILVVYTGGTICSFLDSDIKSLDVERAKTVIVDNFLKKETEYSDISEELFADSGLSSATLSENMTPAKQAQIIENIRSYDLSEYAGIIILHGTDTLAYTAALLSIAFADSTVPIMLVSANRPPDNPLTNANDNFRCAVYLILEGISPNVYVPYKNSDGIMYLHIASTIMQCPNFSEDFTNASSAHVFRIKDTVPKECTALSLTRNTVYPLSESAFLNNLSANSKVLLIQPYTGLDYSSFNITGVRAIVHGTYHSGTVCVERNDTGERYSTCSILYLADMCRSDGIPIFAAPFVYESGQYSSVYDAVQNGVIIPVNMTVEAAYAKAMIGTACGYSGNELNKFMLTDIAGEIIK